VSSTESDSDSQLTVTLTLPVAAHRHATEHVCLCVALYAYACTCYSRAHRARGTHAMYPYVRFALLCIPSQGSGNACRCPICPSHYVGYAAWNVRFVGDFDNGMIAGW
jgi:hypothetical protein